MKKVIWIISIAFLVLACTLGESAPLQVEDTPVESIPTIESATPLLPIAATEPVALPAGPLTLVALGDSLTQGDGDDAGLGGYPGRMLEQVNAVRPGSTMINLGQSGWSSDALINGDQGLESQLDRAVTELQNATAQGRGAVALVWIGSNDLWYLYEYGGDINDEGDTQDLARFGTNMDLILSRLRGTGALVLVALLDDQSQRPVALKGEAFTAVTRDELSRMSKQVIHYNEIITSKASQYGALTVDLYNTDIFINPATLYDDGNHPNSVGYDVIAQKWWEVLKNEIDQ